MAKEHQQLAESSPKASRTSRPGFTSLAKSWRKTCVSHFILDARMEAMKGMEGRTTRAFAFLHPFTLALNETCSLDTATRHIPLFQASMSRCATRQTHSCVPLYLCLGVLHRTYHDGYAANRWKVLIGGVSYRGVLCSLHQGLRSLVRWIGSIRPPCSCDLWLVNGIPCLIRAILHSATQLYPLLPSNCQNQASSQPI